MRIRISTMAVVCGLAALAFSPMSLACDKEKVAGSSCGSKEAKTAQVVQASDKGACCPVTGKTVNAKVAAGCDSCPTDRVMEKLVLALHDMNKCQGGCAGRADVIAAVRILVESKPDLATAGVKTMLASNSSCGSSHAATMAAGNTSHCGSGAKAVQASSGKAACDPSACSSKGKTVAAGTKSSCDPSKCATQAKVVAVGGKSSCDPAACSTTGKAVAASGKSSCDPAACSAQAKAVAAGKSACGSGQARYVAFNCEKTDHMARALARAYLDLMRELKVTTGGEGCSAKAATEVLAAVLQDMQNEQEATASTAEFEVAPVSLGAVGDSCKKTCGASKN
jgi:hypothetical protein